MSPRVLLPREVSSEMTQKGDSKDKALESRVKPEGISLVRQAVYAAWVGLLPCSTTQTPLYLSTSSSENNSQTGLEV